MIGKLWIKFRHSFVGEKIRSFFPNPVVNIFEHLTLAILATVFWRYPARKLIVIGVTGTDGKTTTATLIHKILVEAGKKAALISTVSAKIGRQQIETGFHVTSPHPWKLQKLLRKVVNEGFQYIVIEITSHGLVQNRLFGCNFKVGVITNVAHEHLDYHKTYENYLKAKAKLFNGVKIAVLNRDDESYQFLNLKLKTKNLKLITYGIKHRADFTPKTFKFKTSLPGEYNQYNCLAAIAATASLGIPEDKIKNAITSFRGVEGRMEEINEGQDFKVIIDFAHTPNALENVLKTLKSSIIKPASRDSFGIHQSLITVFGCAGLRDVQKRPIMGEIAAKYADFVVLTAEDPRTEDVNGIIDQIAKGCLKGGAQEAPVKHFNDLNHRSEKKYFFRIPDRGEAIKFAIQKLAKKGDIVVICGKGHEKSMCFGRTEYPWSDKEEAREALRGLN